MSLRKRTLGCLLTVLAVSASLGAAPAAAQPARAVGVTPPRLAFVDGEVSYWRPGAEDWVPAQINTALGAGDSLYAGDGGNFEVEIASRAYVRGGSGTQVGVESLETGYLQLRVPAGHAAVDLRRMPEGQEIEVDTPNGAFLIGHAGYYRFDVGEQETRFSARRGGLARVVPAGGGEVEVGSGQYVVVSGTDTATLTRIAAAGDDAWDRWNFDRTGQLGEQPRSVQYVPPDVAGADDLDRYGDWRETPKYGHVWVPRDVGADWAPYSDGRWVWDGSYGWTWVDYSPWGWAPYHYGRWCWNDGYWGWAPGPIVARPVYSPALVAFFGGPHVGVSVSLGTPFVSWVALGWGEPVVPWWGPRGFVGRPYWGGWGGPRYVNNVEINNTTIINVNTINRYDNFRNRRAVIGVDGNRFGRGRGDHIRVDPDRVRNLRPVRGELGVRPVRESLVARTGRGERPPDRIQQRRVVATRAPQDPARLPRSAGLVREDSRRKPEPRIVAPRTERSGGRREFGSGRNAPPVRGVEPTDVRGRAARSDDVRTNVERRGNAGEGVNRIPGGGRDDGSRGALTRGAPQPPSTNRRVPAERDGNGRVRDGAREGRERTGTLQRGGGDGEATPPSTNRAIQQPRDRDDVTTRGRGQDGSQDRIRMPRAAAPPPDRGGNDARERARNRIEQPQQRPARQERSKQQEAPRPAPQSRSVDRGDRGNARIEQPQQRAPQMPAMEPRRNERPARESSSRSVERQSAPRVERQAAPRREAQREVQRQEAPRVQKGGAGDGSQPKQGNPGSRIDGGGRGHRGHD